MTDTSLAIGALATLRGLMAEIPGKFSALPARAAAMYAPGLKGNSDEIKLRIQDESANKKAEIGKRSDGLGVVVCGLGGAELPRRGNLTLGQGNALAMKEAERAFSPVRAVRAI